MLFSFIRNRYLMIITCNLGKDFFKYHHGIEPDVQNGSKPGISIFYFSSMVTP